MAVLAPTTSYATFITPGANGCKVTGIIATSTDASSRTVTISIQVSAVDYVLMCVTVPANAGTDGTTAAINVLNTTTSPGLPRDNDGQPYFFVTNSSPTALVRAKCSSGTSIMLTAVYGDF